ncbi:uncharacterized protein LOC144152089 [Haemaphysalis longicornis]
MRLSVWTLLLAPTAVLLLCQFEGVSARSGPMQWPRFMNCVRKRAGVMLGTRSGACAANRMYKQFRIMTRVNCKNCDKYFHCMANRLAVQCGGRFSRPVAVVISFCREHSQRESARHRRADEAANKFGRKGGNCAARYLRKAKCAYNPRSGRCKW